MAPALSRATIHGPGLAREIRVRMSASLVSSIGVIRSPPTGLPWPRVRLQVTEWTFPGAKADVDVLVVCPAHPGIVLGCVVDAPTAGADLACRRLTHLPVWNAASRLLEARAVGARERLTGRRNITRPTPYDDCFIRD